MDKQRQNKRPDSIGAIVRAEQNILHSPLKKKPSLDIFPIGSTPQTANKSSCCFANELLQNSFFKSVAQSGFPKASCKTSMLTVVVAIDSVPSLI